MKKLVLTIALFVSMGANASNIRGWYPAGKSLISYRERQIQAELLDNDFVVLTDFSSGSFGTCDDAKPIETYIKINGAYESAHKACSDGNFGERDHWYASYALIEQASKFIAPLKNGKSIDIELEGNKYTIYAKNFKEVYNLINSKK